MAAGLAIGDHDLGRAGGLGRSLNRHDLISQEASCPIGRCRTVAISIDNANGIALLRPNTGQMDAGAGFGYTPFLTKDSYEHFLAESKQQNLKRKGLLLLC